MAALLELEKRWVYQPGMDVLVLNAICAKFLSINAELSDSERRFA